MTDDSADTAPTESTYTEVWAYAGLRTTGTGGFAHSWYRTEQGTHFLCKKRLSHMSIGGQVEVTMTDDEHVYSAGSHRPRPLATRFTDQTRIAGWVAEDAAAHAHRNEQALQRKSQKVEPLEQILAPLSTVARTLTRPQRRALAVHILAALNL